jgi:hypothetical protein
MTELTPLANVLSWLAIAVGAVGASIALFALATARAKGQPGRHAAPSTSWRTVRSCCGVILISSSHWFGGIPQWLLLAAGIWLVLVWDFSSWLRTRYRLTRLG